MKDRLTLKEIADTVCAATGLDIRSPRRRKYEYYARMIYYKIARTETKNNLEKIAKEVNRTHVMVLHALDKFDNDIIMDNNKKIYDSVLWGLGLEKQDDKKEVERITNLELLQLSVLRELKELSYTQLSEFNETRLKPYKKALQSRVMPKVIIEEQGAMLNR